LSDRPDGEDGEQEAKKSQVSQSNVPEIGFSVVGGITQNEVLPID